MKKITRLIPGYPLEYDKNNQIRYPGTYPRVRLKQRGPGVIPEYDQNSLVWCSDSYPSMTDQPGLIPGYLPEYDQNNQIRYPGAPEYVIQCWRLSLLPMAINSLEKIGRKIAIHDRRPDLDLQHRYNATPI